MRKLYRNQTKAKPKQKTKAQRRREWEYTVIDGGLVRANAFPRTAMMLNKGRGAVVRVIGVPLYSQGHLEILEEISEYGLMGQTAAEVASHLVMDGILKAMKDGLIENFRANKMIVSEILGETHNDVDAESTA
jgi:hypothetical protein